MRIRNVDLNWDWLFGSSQLNYATAQTAILLDCQMKLKEWYQDCFFALQNGIPWNIRLGSKNQKQLLDRDIIQTIQNVEGVLNVTDFESQVLIRRYQAKMNIYTQYSSTPQTLSFYFDENKGLIIND